MTPQQLPDVREDNGFQQNAEDYASRHFDKASLRAEFMLHQIHNIVREAYLYGAKEGFRTGWIVRDNRKEEQK